MTISQRVDRYLKGENISYDTVNHPPSHSSVQSAIAAQVPLHSLAKAIILKDTASSNYLMAVIPASCRLPLKQVSDLTDTNLKLASENDINQHFPDCQVGAIPPFGKPYNMEVIWDNRLGRIPDVYMEAGDHQTLIHLNQTSFQKTVEDELHEELSSLNNL